MFYLSYGRSENALCSSHVNWEPAFRLIREMTAPHSCKILMYREKPLSADRCTVVTFALTLLNHGKRFLRGKVFFFFFLLLFFFQFPARLLRWLFLFLLSLLDLGPVITIAETWKDACSLLRALPPPFSPSGPASAAQPLASS